MNAGVIGIFLLILINLQITHGKRPHLHIK